MSFIWQPRCFTLFNRLLFVVGGLCLHATAWSAACCASGVAVPSLIVMYQPVQVSISASWLESTSVVTPQAYWLANDQLKIFRSRFDSSWLLSSDKDENIWQGGLSLVSENRCYAGGCTRLSLMQIEAYLAFEWLAESYYQHWHPQLISWLKLSWPTSDLGISNEVYIDRGVLGRQVNLGLLVRKSFVPTRWDGVFVQQVVKGLPTRVIHEGQELNRDQSYSMMSQIGLGYSVQVWRYGIQWIHVFLSPWSYSSSMWGNGVVPESQVDTLQFSLSYSGWNHSSISLFFARDDLVGYPINTTLFHSMGFVWQYHPP